MDTLEITHSNALELTHKRGHEFICDKCNHTFKYQSNLTAHKKRKTPCDKLGITSQPSQTPISGLIQSSSSNLDLLTECLQTNTLSELSKKISVCTGTIIRWQLLKKVPPQYTFELYKLLGRQIDYTKYTSAEKDQFFTPAELAKECWAIFREKVPVNLDEYIFIEPSAGDGSFLRVLPPGTIGLDIEPRAPNITKQDYMTWSPPASPHGQTPKKYIVFGNPPFGLRGHMALNFIMHSQPFADYVCFILPQLFESDGKGSPRKRVTGYNLIYSKTLSAMFYSPEKQEVKVNGVFQIWSKNTTNNEYKLPDTNSELLKVYSLSDGGTVATTRNKNMLTKCHIYLPSTCFGKENMRVYQSFEELPGRKGYGIVFAETVKLQKIIQATAINWSDVAFLSTNSAYNLRTSRIMSQFAGLPGTQPQVQVTQPQVQVTQPQVQVTQPQVQVTQPQVQVTQPQVAPQPQVQVTQPQVQVTQPQVAPQPQVQ
jgi:hypothetical protein